MYILCLYMYVCMYIYICMYVYLYVYIYVYIYKLKLIGVRSFKTKIFTSQMD